MTKLTPELKKKIEAHMICSERLERALEIIRTIDNEELQYLLEIEYNIKLEEERMWNDAEEGTCPECGGKVPREIKMAI
jgi:hypothetical protein